MSVTFVPDVGTLWELAIADEATYGTYATPDVQLTPVAPPSFGLGHQVIEGQAMIGSVQEAVTHAAIRGIDVPWCSFEVPWSGNNLTHILHMLTGTAEAANVWAIADSPSGFSIGVNSTAGDYFKFAGTRVATAVLNMPLGGMPTILFSTLGRRLIYPDTAPTTFPSLTPVVTQRPYILQDCTLKHSATTAFAGGAVKMEGFVLNVDCGLLVSHNSSHTSPEVVQRTRFAATGQARFKFGADLWDEWKSIIADGDAGGYDTRYLEFRLNDGTTNLALTLPCKVDFEEGFTAAEGAVSANLSLRAGADDAAITNPVITVTDA